MAGAHADEFRARQPDPGARLDPVGHEVGARGIADDDIGQPLPAQAEVGNPVTGRNALLRQRAVDVMGRDLPAFDPQREQREQRGEQRQRKDEKQARAAPRPCDAAGADECSAQLLALARHRSTMPSPDNACNCARAA